MYFSDEKSPFEFCKYLMILDDLSAKYCNIFEGSSIVIEKNIGLSSFIITITTGL